MIAMMMLPCCCSKEVKVGVHCEIPSNIQHYKTRTQIHVLHSCTGRWSRKNRSWTTSQSNVFLLFSRYMAINKVQVPFCCRYFTFGLGDLGLSHMSINVHPSSIYEYAQITSKGTYYTSQERCVVHYIQMQHISPSIWYSNAISNTIIYTRYAIQYTIH